MWTARPGDDVRVTLKDGRRVRFKVHSVDDKGIVAGNRARYEATDIVLIERRTFSTTKTVFLVGAGIALAVCIAYAAATASLLTGQ
jgi:hypothetical protein